MKMSDVFKSELLPSHIRVKSTPVKRSMDDSVVAHEFICDAVNNHDKLTERVKELEECLSNFLIADEMIGSGMNVHGGLSMMTGNMDIAKQLLEKE